MGRPQFRESLQPQAGCLALRMTELPRLDDLIRPANPRRDDRHRILQSNPRDGRSKKRPHKVQSFCLLALLSCEVPRPTHGQVCAWRMRHHEIPAVTQNAQNVALDVPPERFARQQVATPRLMPTRREGIAHGARELTGHKHPHATPLPWISFRAAVASPCDSAPETALGLATTGHPLTPSGNVSAGRAIGRVAFVVDLTNCRPNFAFVAGRFLRELACEPGSSSESGHTRRIEPHYSPPCSTASSTRALASTGLRSLIVAPWLPVRQAR